MTYEAYKFEKNSDQKPKPTENGPSSLTHHNAVVDRRN